MRFLLIVTLFLWHKPLKADNILLSKAENAMANGKYSQALASYKALDSLGYGDEAMYYNMVIATHSEGKMADAVLYAEKARKYNPASSSINQLVADLNLTSELSEGAFSDPLSARIMNFLTGYLLADTWAGIALFLFAVFLFYAWLVFPALPKPSYLSSIKLPFKGLTLSSTAILCFISFMAAYYRHNQIFHNSAKIIMVTGCKLKVGPDSLSPDIMELQPGTKVYYNDSLDTWCEVTTTQGDKGWILSASAKKV